MKEDDKVIISDVESSEDWWYGEVAATGAMGWVPRSYLAMDDRRVARLYSLDSQDDCEKTPKPTSTPSSSSSSSSSSSCSSPSTAIISKKGSFSRLDSATLHLLMPVKADREIRAVFEEFDIR